MIGYEAKREDIMKALKAMRTKIKIGDLWVSPELHVLLTKEDNVFVARCLDFTVSSHGEDEEDAIKSLAEAIQEYILTSIENSETENLYDPAHNKYWRMFNELKAKGERLENGVLASSLKPITYYINKPINIQVNAFIV